MPPLSLQIARQYARHCLRSRTAAFSLLAGILAGAQVMTTTAASMTSAPLRLEQLTPTLDLLTGLAPISLILFSVLAAILHRRALAWGATALSLLAVTASATLPWQSAALQGSAESLHVLLAFGLSLLANLIVTAGAIWSLGKIPSSPSEEGLSARVLLWRAAAVTVSMSVISTVTSHWLSQGLQLAEDDAAWNMLVGAGAISLVGSAALRWLSGHTSGRQNPSQQTPSQQTPSPKAPTDAEAEYVPPLWISPALLLMTFALGSLAWWLLNSPAADLLHARTPREPGIGGWTVAQLIALSAPLLGGACLWLISHEPGRQGEKALMYSLLLPGLVGWAMVFSGPLVKTYESWDLIAWLGASVHLNLWAAHLVNVTCGLTAAWYLAGTVKWREDRALAVVVRRPALAGLLVGAALAGDSLAGLMAAIDPTFMAGPGLMQVGAASYIGTGLLVRRAMA